MTAVVQGVDDQPGLPEPLRDVVIAPGVFAEAVGEDDDAFRSDVGRPYVVDDADPADAVECLFTARAGHSRERIRSKLSWVLRKLANVTVLAHRLDDDSPADAFLADAQRYRRELLAHCYRMTGSLHDAEDLVQETYLRAWKSYEGFQGKSSVRTWLYRIATNTCLTALEGRQRRPLPSGLGNPSSSPTDEIAEHHEIPWLQPLPDSTEDPADPSTIVGTRDSVRLAFVAALQHLSARQRAVLVMREVLQWKAAEVGEAIGASTAAVNSLLQRARAQLDAVGPTEDDEIAPPDSPHAQNLLRNYMAAFEAYDVDKLVELFTAEAIWEMPPFDSWYRGPEAIGGLTRHKCPAEQPGDMRFIATSANGQPAAGMYMLNRQTGRHEAFQLHVLEVRPEGISHVVAFMELELFEKFGLPAEL